MSKEKINDLEMLIIKLQKVREDKLVTESNRMFAASLLTHYMNFKDLSFRQQIAANNLINRSKPKRKEREPTKSYYLYAITNNSEVKIGFSSNVKKRLKALQTSNSSVLKCLWSYSVGNNRYDAVNNEKKLHRLCRAHRIRGEWFESDCMVLVKSFTPKLTKQKQPLHRYQSNN